MKKQNLFFIIFLSVVTFLILPKFLRAALANSDESPMRADIFKEEEKIPTSALPTTTSGGSIKAEVKPIVEPANENKDAIQVPTRNTSEETEMNLDNNLNKTEQLPTVLQSTITVVAPTEIKPAIEAIINSTNNKQMKEVEVTGSTIKIEYAQPVKLFGFVPLKTNLALTANVQSKKVEIKKPWWLFFASYNVAEVKNQIENEINKEPVASPAIAIAPIDTFSNIIKIFSNLIK